MAGLGTATTPAAAPAAPRFYNRHPRHHIAARRNRVASARRRLDLCASASPAVTAPDIPDEAVAEPLVEQAPETKLGKLACPICYYPLASSSDQSDGASSLECSTCKKFYPNKQDYWDLTVSVGSTEYSESMPAATELFRCSGGGNAPRIRASDSGGNPGPAGAGRGTNRQRSFRRRPS